MKILVQILAVAVLFMFNTAQAKTTFNTRILLHATHTNIEDTGFGIASWVIAPNITSSPTTWLGIVGPRFDGEGWNLELLAGAVIDSGIATPLIDIRFELTPKLFDVPLYVWGNMEVIDFDGPKIYSYLQIDYKLPAGIGLVGVETENVVPLGKEGDWSVGPHVVFPLGKHFAMIAAYQFHFGASSDQQFWLRAVINL